ncbi:MAG TPA: ATP-binding protein [Candidatus Avalokitesvara rifleensis]|uniref:ATP-binding protein n=1 Tax=Candidatus Avalokitesvara rifleensis TaxID=3367620 RepID=UPI002712BD0C|nr:ATP-binding protein [Candidatus Brocadiales bacterium]
MKNKTWKRKYHLFYKVSGALFLLLAMEAGTMGMSLYFTYRMQKDIRVLSHVTAQERRILEEAFLVNKYATDDALTRDETRDRIAKVSGEFEKTLYAFRDGDEDMGISPAEKGPGMDYNYPWWQFNRFILNSRGTMLYRNRVLGSYTPEDLSDNLNMFNKAASYYMVDVGSMVRLFQEGFPKRVATFQIILAALFGVTLALVGAIHLLAWRYVERPIRELNQSIQDISGGSLDRQIPVRTSDEIGEMAHSFNTMARALKDRTSRLANSEALLNGILSDIDMGVRVVDPRTNLVTYQNAAMAMLTSGAVGNLCYSAWQRGKTCENCVSLKAIKDLLPHNKIETTPDGRFYEVLAFPFVSPGGTVTSAIEIIRDVTEKKMMEHQIENGKLQLLQSQKLAAVGHLAGGIAHSINNPLSGITLYAEILLKKIDDFKGAASYEKLREGLTNISEAAKRCDVVVKDLLRISRMPKDMQMTPVSVNEALEHCLNIAQPKLKLQYIGLENRLQSGIPQIVGNHQELEMVFLNILSNSVDAMPQGGVLTISSRYVPEEDMVEVGIEDTGIGISRKDLPYVFNPYFTTKPPGSGTGLGLSMSMVAIQRHRGTIDIDSEPGKGTKVVIKLPAYHCKKSEGAEQGNV